MGSLLYVFSMLFIVSAIFFYPLVVIARSDKVHGISKLIWCLLALFFSWPAFIVFLIVTH